MAGHVERMAILWTILTTVHELLVALAIIAVLRRPREPRAMLAWILTLLFVPVMGLLLFVLIGEPRVHRTRKRRRRRRLRIRQAMRFRLSERRARIPQKISYSPDPTVASFMKLATRIGGRPPTRGNQVIVHHDAERMFLEMSLAIQAARAHVHMEYYIFQPDETGRAIRDLLVAKAREGVKCRLLLDFVGCWKLFNGFLRPMRDAGVEVVFFMPWLPWKGSRRLNFRNHRKIVVIDGELAFTGSQNIGDEYAGRRRGLKWRDTHVRVTGPAVHHMQEVFFEDWAFASRHEVEGSLATYFPPVGTDEQHLVQVIPSGPDREANVLHHLLLGAIAAARKTISLATPYFVPDQAMVLSLQTAAYRGVQVRLLIPSKTDHPVVLWAGRSFYNELCRAGVEIYEYDQGMLHSKMIIGDDLFVVVGSANFDERSLRLNFELSTVLYEPLVAGQLYADFEEQRGRAKRIRFQKHFSVTDGVKLGLARLISPLL